MTAKKVHIAIPSYSGEIGAPTVIALCRAIEEAKAAGWETEVNIRPHDSLLPRCRNAMLSQFLAGDASDFVFWDADIAPEPGGLNRLLSHPVDFVAGLYRSRADPELYIFRPLPGDVEDKQTGLVEVEGVGTGFLRVTRAAIKKMIAFYPDLWIDDRGTKLAWLFDFELRDHQYYSEDFTFCRRWREAGGRVWADPDLGFFHTGPKTFAGKYADHWRRQLAAKTTPAELADAQARIDALFNSYLN